MPEDRKAGPHEGLTRYPVSVEINDLNIHNMIFLFIYS